MTKIPVTTTEGLLQHIYLVFLVHGLLSILVAVLVFFYPLIITILITATFLWFGFIALVMAWRIRKFQKEVSNISP